MALHAVTVSFRLGGDDGVSVESRKWEWALGELGFALRRVTGLVEDAARADDVVLPGLAISASTPPPGATELDAALDGADLVVVDNICSLPLNLGAARSVAAAVQRHDGRVLFRHHDLPWQRRHLAHLEREFPPRRVDAVHVTVNLRSRRELEARGYARVDTVHNYFDLDAAPGDRDGTRDTFGFGASELVLLQPARAIERKNVPGGLRFAQQLARTAGPVRYWLSGPAEDDYAPTLERITERAVIPVTMGRAARAADAYAACDLVVFPSTWEGFGNPVVESIAARRACAAHPYPVLAEIVAAGIRTFSTEHPESVARFLEEPEAVRERYYDVNLRRARVSFSLAELPAAIDAVFARHGWQRW